MYVYIVASVANKNAWMVVTWCTKRSTMSGLCVLTNNVHTFICVSEIICVMRNDEDTIYFV